ncbi:uncharacterized protein CBL_12659 [Carabus blaptoides fortunei]
MFVVCELAVFIIKAINLTLPTGTLESELSILLFLFVIEAIRIFLGRKGNLTENNIPVIFSILLTIPSAIGVLYCLLWQTYVLRLEWILCTIELGLQAAELIFAIVSLLPFYKSTSY